ncbi:MAG: hypothetical protein U1F65_12475, partial [Verrucomicrobiota bacterium]
MARRHAGCLPSVRNLSETMRLHPSTLFRILRDLAAEGVVWQNSSGRFFPAAVRKHHVRGLPVYFIGREMSYWNRLYQEILAGVSEVCAANGSPLILLSARSLVRQADPAAPPVFASVAVQERELGALLPSIPGKCGGILLDHLWSEAALARLGMPGTSKVQLVHGTGREVSVAAPDIAWSACCARKFLEQEQIKQIDLVVPFRGDAAIDAALTALRGALEGLPFREITFGELNGNMRVRTVNPGGGRRCLICAEDNTAQFLLQQLNALGRAGANIFLLGTQGTGLLTAPARRLRVDYRRLGRAAASRLLHGTPVPRLRAALVAPQS